MSEEQSSIIVTRYSDVKTTSVRWLWFPFIAIGKITILQGDPGDGKSTMMMNLIAELSTGGATPDGQAFGRAQRVIYQCAEDGVSDTIKPRLESAGADCRNIAFLNEDIYSSLTLDDERMRQAIIDFRPRLVVIDPFQAYLGNGTDIKITGRARKLMHRLSLWASTYDCAVVLIGHLNKNESGKELYRSLGSIDVVAAARSVLQVERDEEDEYIRVVKQIKNSLAPSGGEIKFEICPQTGFKWLGVSVAPVQAQRNRKTEKAPEFETKMEKAAYLIKEMLLKSDMKSVDIYKNLEAEGISRRTAEDTRKNMGIRCYRKMKQWYWSIKPMEKVNEEAEKDVRVDRS